MSGLQDARARVRATGTAKSFGNLARSHDWAVRSDSESNGDSLRSGPAVAARRIRDISPARGDGNEHGGDNLGSAISDSGSVQNGERFWSVVSRTFISNGDLDRALALSSDLVSTRLPVKSESDGSIRLGAVRMLDIITHPSPGVRMPATLVVITISLFILLIDPSDWVGEVKGALAVLVPFFIYWLKQRQDAKKHAKKEADKTADALLRFTSDKEERLEESARALREEERTFMHNQMELSRRRGHVLARGYMAVELANDRLIELLRANKIEVPGSLLTYQTRAMILGELKELEAEGKQKSGDTDGLTG